MAKQQYTVTEVDGNVRVDKLLAHLHNEYSRAALTKLFNLKLIKYKGEYIEPGFKLKPGNTFEYDLGPLQAKPEVIPIPIIYEDENVIVVDKPVGMISHARGKFWQEASVASFIRDQISGMDGERGGIVHRLDRATSGVMVCAKNEQTLKLLQKQFSDRKIDKIYLAVVEGTPKEQEAVIDAPIARNPKDPKQFMVSTLGKPSQTYYRIIRTNENKSLLQLKPKTGRTHQLRVHLSYIGHPIIGDPLYNSNQSKNDRMLLHALSIKINIPGKDNIVFESKLPEEFEI